MWPRPEWSDLTRSPPRGHTHPYRSRNTSRPSGAATRHAHDSPHNGWPLLTGLLARHHPRQLRRRHTPPTRRRLNPPQLPLPNPPGHNTRTHAVHVRDFPWCVKFVHAAQHSRLTDSSATCSVSSRSDHTKGAAMYDTLTHAELGELARVLTDGQHAANKLTQYIWDNAGIAAVPAGLIELSLDLGEAAGDAIRAMIDRIPPVPGTPA